MPDNVMAITIIFIVASALIATFVRRITRDRCLKDFENNRVTLEKTDGSIFSGRVHVENTGLEFIYGSMDTRTSLPKDTYLLYKAEFPTVLALIRYHDELTESNRLNRERQLKKTYHPGFWRRLGRKTKNIFKTLRDSLMEIINLLISQAKKVGPAGSVLSSQDKYVTRMKTDLVGSVGTSYEPLLEKYIGNKVILVLSKGEALLEYCGVLKEYTADFIEIMDVDYTHTNQGPAKKADLIVPRQWGTVRHLAE
jgi:hypothetical protein